MLVAPLIRSAKHGGGPRTVGALSKDLPPKSAVWRYASRWEWDGAIERMHHVLDIAVREQAGRDAGHAVCSSGVAALPCALADLGRQARDA